MYNFQIDRMTWSDFALYTMKRVDSDTSTSKFFRTIAVAIAHCPRE
ncbi:hypothetical protein CKA32_006432 [Geitlerinema sp. FC II]|nr:hypothetical protein CKA32_006432 [Geitlerinema sp. FC II]